MDAVSYLKIMLTGCYCDILRCMLELTGGKVASHSYRCVSSGEKQIVGKNKSASR
jgi:hypothetical protein